LGQTPGQDPAALLKSIQTVSCFCISKTGSRALKEIKPGTADVETNVVLGQGDVNISAVMKAAKKIGVKVLLYRR
jgi:Trk K+ transport system NAD-binding subunit